MPPRALAAVTDCCVRGATALDAQAVATVLHAHASGGCAPAEASLRALQQRAATLASDGDFNPQDSANTVWAFAKLGVLPTARWRRRWRGASPTARRPR